MLRAGIEIDDGHLAVRDAHRGLDRFGEPLRDIGPGAEPVDDDVDVVMPGLRELRRRIELHHLAVDPDAHEAPGAEVLQQFDVLTLALRDDGGEHHDPGLGREREHGVDDLRDRLRGERHAVVRAVRFADAGVEQAEVVVDLGDRPDGRARIVAGRLLLDRDGRGQPLDHVDVGLLHELEELPGVRRQRFHVAALTLGVERVERERGLAGPRQPRDDRELAARQVEAHVLQVVGARAADADEIHERACRTG